MPMRIIRAWTRIQREPSITAELGCALGGIVWVYFALTDVNVSHPARSFVVPLIGLMLFIGQLFAVLHRNAAIARLSLAAAVATLWVVLILAVVEKLGLHPYVGAYFAAFCCNVFASADLIALLAFGPERKHGATP